MAGLQSKKAQKGLDAAVEAHQILQKGGKISGSTLKITGKISGGT